MRLSEFTEIWIVKILLGHQLQMKCADPLSFYPYGRHNDMMQIENPVPKLVTVLL